ncbi:MAG: metal-dependent transcriptional regulator, partial [Bacteroidota bacterium]
LDKYLNFPKFDPHGDPIPDASGRFTFRRQVLLMDLEVNDSGIIVGVQEHSSPFLRYLDQLKLGLGAKVELLEKFEYDGSIKIRLEEKQEQILTAKVCQNIFVQKNR